MRDLSRFPNELIPLRRVLLINLLANRSLHLTHMNLLLIDYSLLILMSSRLRRCINPPHPSSTMLSFITGLRVIESLNPP